MGLVGDGSLVTKTCCRWEVENRPHPSFFLSHMLNNRGGGGELNITFPLKNPNTASQCFVSVVLS